LVELIFAINKAIIVINYLSLNILLRVYHSISSLGLIHISEILFLRSTLTSGEVCSILNLLYIGIIRAILDEYHMVSSILELLLRACERITTRYGVWID
jgi:hypothetical protein